MGRKTLTPEQLTTVSDIASKIHEYEVIFSNQAAILRQDMKGLYEAHARVFAGQSSSRAPMDSNHEDHAEWKSAMEVCCRMEPRSPDDRVKIAGAALALSTSYIRNLYKVPRHVMLAICAERTRLHDSWMARQKAHLQPDTTYAAPLSQSSSIVATLPRTPSTPPLEILSWDYIESGNVDLLPVEDCIPDFGNVPSRLLGHVFLHKQVVDDDDELFKIVDRISSDLRGTSFEVQFVDLKSTIMIPEAELLDMVRHSTICWKNKSL